MIYNFNAPYMKDQGIYTGSTEDSFKTDTQILYENLDKVPPIYSGNESEMSFNDWIDELSRRRDVRLDVEGIPSEGEIEIKTDTPVVVALMGDQHISGLYHDYELLRDHVNFVRSCPKAYVIMGGDVVDGAAFNPAQDDKIASFNEEVLVARKMFDWLKDSMLCACAGDHDCMDDKTSAFTRQGWKNYDEITYDDEFLTIREDGVCEWHKPENIIIEDFEGELNSISGRHIDMKITDRHRIAYKRRKSDSIETASAIDFIENHSLDNNQFVVSGLNTNKEYDIKDCWIKLVAWIITDGHINGRVCGITQREEKAHLPRQVLIDCGIQFGESTRQRERDYISGKKVLSTKPVVDFRIGVDGRNKLLHLLNNNKYIIPDWIWKLSSRQFDVFLESLVDGDGSRKKDKIVCFYQKNSELIDQLQALCVFNGYRTSIYEYRDSQLRLNINKKEVVRAVNAKIAKEKYSGKIWDITVPNHVFLVRRNGKAYFTGNSWSEKMGITMYHDFTERYKRPLFRGSSTLKLKIGGIDYTVVMAHKLPGHSIYNKTHPQNRESKFGQQGADVYVGWHNHQKGISQQTAKQAGKEDIMQTFVAPGAYKYSDSYSRKQGYSQQSRRELGAVWLVLHPDRKEVEAYWNMESVKERIDPYLKGNYSKPITSTAEEIIHEIGLK